MSAHTLMKVCRNCGEMNASFVLLLVDTLLVDRLDWLFCEVKLEASFAGLFRSTKDGHKSFFERVALDASYLAQFLSDFVRVKSNVSPRPST